MKREMKHHLSIAGLVAVCMVLGSAMAHAGSIDYLSNQSADYIRSFARNHATDGADVVFYNPAGAAWLADDGLYLQLNWQGILKDYRITYEGETYSSTKPTPFLPSFFAVYKWRDLAGFASFNVPAGGGSLKYEKGVPFLNPLVAMVESPDGVTPTDGFFEGSSMYLSPSFGAAYRFFNMVSISAVGRVIMATKTYNGHATYGTVKAELDAEKKAVGFGGIFGVHVRPIEQLNIGIRYETETPLEFEASTKTTNLKTDDFADGPLESFAEGAKEKKNLPSLLGAGISFDVLPQLTLAASFTYYFIKAADAADDGTTPLPWVISYDDDYDNGIDLAFAAEFRFNDMWRASVGYNHSWGGGNSKTLSDFEYTLSSNSIGGGVRVHLIDRLDITAAMAMTLYLAQDNEGLHAIFPQPETFDKTAFVFSLGAQYRLF